MTPETDKEKLARVKAAIADAIDRNAGVIWRSAENAWQDVSRDFPAGVRAHCLQVVYVEVDDGDDFFSNIAGCSLSSPPDLSKKNIAYILTAIMAQLSAFELKPVKRGKGNAGVPDADL